MEADRGEDFGRVSAVGDAAAKKCAGRAAPAAPAASAQVAADAAPRRAASATHRAIRRAPRAPGECVPSRADEVTAASVIERVRDTQARDEGERRRVAVGPDQTDGLLHRGAAGRLPRAGARPRRASSGPASSCGRSASATRRRGSAASAAAAGSTAAPPGSRSSPRSISALAKDQHLSLNPSADLGRLRPAALLPQVRARVLRRVPEALPREGKTVRDAARHREGDRGGHLPGARLPAR